MPTTYTWCMRASGERPKGTSSSRTGVNNRRVPSTMFRPLCIPDPTLCQRSRTHAIRAAQGVHPSNADERTKHRLYCNNPVERSPREQATSLRTGLGLKNTPCFHYTSCPPYGPSRAGSAQKLLLVSVGAFSLRWDTTSHTRFSWSPTFCLSYHIPCEYILRLTL